mgnify:CR=1 FL=1
MEAKHDKLIEFIKKRGGFARYSDLIKAGFYKALINDALDSGQLERFSRGVYSLSEIDLSQPDFVTVSVMVPKGVICLISALSFHEATDEIPQAVDLAITRGTRASKINYPPVKFYRLAPETWKAGIEEHEIDGHKIRVYCLAKTIADCFKFRNKVGVDVAREALKIAVIEKKIKPKEIMRYSKICRVDRIIKPLIEAML